MMSVLTIIIFIFSYKAVYTLQDQTADNNTAKSFSPCEDGWSHYGQHCYKRVDEDIGWEDASASCIAKGGHLASIHSKEESDFIHTLLKEKIPRWGNFFALAWIGLRNQTLDGKMNAQWDFRWEDGSELNFTNWDDLEPKGRVKCVIIFFDHASNVGKWKTAGCRLILPYVCQKMIQRNENESKKKITKPVHTLPDQTADSSTKKSSSLCDEGWSHYGQHCYKREDEDLGWSDASASCVAMGGHLASIHSKEESDFIDTLLMEKIPRWGNFFALAWIGLRDQTSQHDFRWEDGSDLNFTNWDDLEPEGKVKCVRIFFNHASNVGKWKNAACDLLIPYVCQKTTYIVPNQTADIIPAKSSSSCEENWARYGQHCYKRRDEDVSWADASDRCKILGGHLASIHSKEDSDFIDTLLMEKLPRWGNFMAFAWIGLHDENYEHNFRWIDGSNFNYTNWDDSEPEGKVDCVTILFNHTTNIGKWRTANCRLILPYVCQKKIQRAENRSNETDKSSSYIVPNQTPDILPAKSSSSCEENWARYGQYCYKREDEDVNWANAVAKCMTMGGHLTSIHSKEESDFIDTLLMEKLPRWGNFMAFAWIGLHDENSELKFKWEDGTSLNYTNWADSEPGGKVNCVTILFNHTTNVGKWRTANCRLILPYVCQKKIKNTEYKSEEKYIEPIKNTEYKNKEKYMETIQTTGIIPAKSLSLCEEGWAHYGQNCYKRENEDISWHNAKASCNAMGGYLTSIHSKEESEFIDTLLMEKIPRWGNNIAFAWIGLSNQTSHNGLRWEDGSDLDFTNWDELESRKQIKCVTIFFNHTSNVGKWRTSGCRRILPYVCQKKIQSTENKYDKVMDNTVPNTVLPNKEVEVKSEKLSSFNGDQEKQAHQYVEMEHNSKNSKIMQ